MSYTKTTWQNDQAPAINATNLNKIEQGIYDNDVNISGINETLGVDTNTWIGTTAYGEGDIVIYNDKIYQNISGTSTTTNPAEDTTNWDEITIFDTDSINDDLIDKTKFINNSSTNSGVKTYSCNYINDLQPVELYYNANGTTGNITLSDSVANYNEIEIEFSRSGYIKTTGRIKQLNLTLDGYWYYYDNGLGKVVYQNYCEIPSISGTTITRRDTYYTNVVGDGGGTYTGNFAGGIAIIRVLGYK